MNEPQLPAEGPVVPAPVHEPPITIMAAFSRFLKNHLDVADEIQTIHHELRTHAPGGFQAEELSAILERRHGGPQMGVILESLRAERSPYFQEIQTDFRNLQNAGGTEAQLRKEWQGRA